MKKLTVTTLLIICVVGVAFADVYNVADPTVLSKSRMKLNMGWDFYKGRFINPDELGDLTPDRSICPPECWLEEYPDGLGCGTFNLCLANLHPDTQYAFFVFDTIGTSCNFFVNGQLLATIGQPNEDFKKAKPDQKMDLIEAKSDEDGRLNIVIQVSNNFHRKGGLWGTMYFGELRIMQKHFLYELDKRFAFLGILLCVLFFHLIYFLIKKEDKSSLFLALFILGLILRLVVQGFSIVKCYIPNFPYGLSLKLEYTAIYVSPALYALYLRSLYGEDCLTHNLDLYIVFINVFIMLMAWIGPISFVNRLVPVMELDFIVCSIILVYGQFKISSTNKQSINTMIIGVASAIIALFALHDVFVFNNVPIMLPTINLLPYSMIIFVGAQSIISARNRETAMSSIKKISDDLEQTNEIYQKFVPREFLPLFSGSNITNNSHSEVKKTRMALFTADIRNFVCSSKVLSEDEVFKLLNKYYATIGPIIRSNGGLIEKYLGDGIIAMMPDHGENAVKCALEMQDATDKLFAEFNQRLGQNFRIRISIHYGEVLLATDGDSEHSAELTITNAVDTVLRLEALTNKYSKPILVSKSYIEYVGISEKYNFQYVDTIFIEDEQREEELYTV